MTLLGGHGPLALRVVRNLRLLVYEVAPKNQTPWLLFVFFGEGHAIRRRLQPVPRDWASRSDEELIRMFERAVPPTLWPWGMGGLLEDRAFVQSHAMDVESYVAFLLAENVWLREELATTDMELESLNEELRDGFKEEKAWK